MESTSPYKKSSNSFAKFIFLDKKNQQLLGIALSGLIGQFIIFKLLYPFPDFFSDSYSYLFAAYAHLDINIWPIGYSKFLSAFHNLTYSGIGLVGFQYFFLELSALLFFFSYIYFYSPSKQNQTILFLFLFFNPLFLYLSNYINSDPLFAALSLLWFTQLIWIVNKPKKIQIIVHALLLFLCFTVRNNAYYYPILGCIAFVLSGQSMKLKIAGILTPFLFIIPFVLHTEDAAYNMTGARQFSLFTGWQLANNALYIRGHIHVDSLKLPNAETRELDRLSEAFFSATKPEFDTYLSDYVANYFIRQPEAPLKRYFNLHYHASDEYKSVADWGKASVIFGDYGKYLIKTNPLAFTRYFLLRNVKNYFLPPLEKLGVYNLGMNEVDPIAQYWFHFPNKSVTAFSIKGQGKLLFLYPLIFFFINLFSIANFLWVLISKRIHQAPSHARRYIVLISCFLLLNMSFSILATINVFRYQFFPMIVCLTFSLMTLELLDKKEITTLNPVFYAR